VIRKNVRWKRIKFNILIFGSLFVIVLLILLIPETRNHGYSDTELPVSQEIANANASKIIAQLVDDGQLDESWRLIPVTSARKIVFKGNREWEVIFANKKITDPAKQKIYVFLTLSGEHVAVNYSGN
jgi:hypothetical protein